MVITILRYERIMFVAHVTLTDLFLFSVSRVRLRERTLSTSIISEFLGDKVNLYYFVKLVYATVVRVILCSDFRAVLPIDKTVTSNDRISYCDFKFKLTK